MYGVLEDCSVIYGVGQFFIIGTTRLYLVCMFYQSLSLSVSRLSRLSVPLVPPHRSRPYLSRL